MHHIRYSSVSSVVYLSVSNLMFGPDMFLFFCLFICFAMHSLRSVSQTTVDPDEVRRFQSLAGKWWDEQGEFAALHAMNDLRVPFIRCVPEHNTCTSIFILFIF